MFAGRWAGIDPEFGRGTVVRGSRRITATLVTAGFVQIWFAWGGLQPPPAECSSCTSTGAPAAALWGLMAGAGWLVAFAYWRTRLFVGERGFRWRRPWKPFQGDIDLAWAAVQQLGIDGAYSPSRSSNWLVVAPDDAREFRIRHEFSLGWWDLFELMNDQWKAARAASPGHDGPEAKPAAGTS